MLNMGGILRVRIAPSSTITLWRGGACDQHLIAPHDCANAPARAPPCRRTHYQERQDGERPWE